MASLYDIDKELIELLEHGFNESCIDKETGEIDEAKAQEFLTNLPMERDKKLETYGLIIKNLDADADAIKQEEQRLAERRKQKEKTVERLKNNITTSMLAFGDAKIETAKVCMSLRKSQAVEIAENVELPKQFITVKTTETPNKVELKKALLNGETVNGVTLVERQNIQIK